jgi:iron complex outermembrane receptor protein
MSEIANVAEIGYRSQYSDVASFSLTAFAHRYPNLRSVEAVPPAPVLGNGFKGRTTGLEGWGTWRVVPAWRLAGGFVLLREHFERKQGSADVGGASQLANDPRQTAQLRSSWDVGRTIELDAAARYTGKLPDPAVPAYTVVDARLGWRAMPGLELSLVVQNLFDRKYSETGAANMRAQFERSFFVKAQWKL